MSSSVRQLVTRARDEVCNMSVPEVAGALEGGGVTLVDLREPDEVRREGAIPGAVPAPRGMLEFWADPASPYHREEFVPSARTIRAAGRRWPRRRCRRSATPTSHTSTADWPRGRSRGGQSPSRRKGHERERIPRRPSPDRRGAGHVRRGHRRFRSRHEHLQAVGPPARPLRPALRAAPGGRHGGRAGLPRTRRPHRRVRFGRRRLLLRTGLGVPAGRGERRGHGCRRAPPRRRRADRPVRSDTCRASAISWLCSRSPTSQKTSSSRGVTPAARSSSGSDPTLGASRHQRPSPHGSPRPYGHQGPESRQRSVTMSRRGLWFRRRAPMSVQTTTSSIRAPYSPGR